MAWQSQQQRTQQILPQTGIVKQPSSQAMISVIAHLYYPYFWMYKNFGRATTKAEIAAIYPAALVWGTYFITMAALITKILGSNLYQYANVTAAIGLIGAYVSFKFIKRAIVTNHMYADVANSFIKRTIYFRLFWWLINPIWISMPFLFPILLR